MPTLSKEEYDLSPINEFADLELKPGDEFGDLVVVEQVETGDNGVTHYKTCCKRCGKTVVIASARQLILKKKQRCKFCRRNLFEYQGQLMDLSELEAHSPMSANAIRHRIKDKGIPVEEAVLTPNKWRERRSSANAKRSKALKAKLKSKSFKELVDPSSLSVLQKQILYARFVKNHTLQQIADVYGTSRQWISQLETEALETLLPEAN